MDIRPYTGISTMELLFLSNKKTIVIWMESSEILADDIIDVPLSNLKTISGKLNLREVKKIYYDDVLIDVIEKDFDYAEIFEFSIEDDIVDLLVEWRKNNQKPQTMNLEHLFIHASKIEWENIPNLLDSF